MYGVCGCTCAILCCTVLFCVVLFAKVDILTRVELLCFFVLYVLYSSIFSTVLITFINVCHVCHVCYICHVCNGRVTSGSYACPSPRSFALVPPTFTVCLEEALKTPLTKLEKS